MKSRLAESVRLGFEPVATLWTDEAPEGAIAFGEGKTGCVISLMASAAKGKIGVTDSKRFGCPGAGVGLGYGDCYTNVFPGGRECFCHFLSSGNEGFPKGEAVISGMKGRAPEHFLRHFSHGERYIKNPELTEDFVDTVGFINLDKMTVFKPLSMVDPEKETPVSVTFVCKPAQLSAMVIMCNYFRKGIENVKAPFGAGCHSVGILTYKEAGSENPKGVIGMFDITARKTIKKSLGEDVLTFSMPYSLFLEMEANVEGSFLEEDQWKELIS
ncbi:hypothetical protein EP073_10740 [Geovibrio thiophilus]|uniref:DUF169 domain-containing protein n=1 Tax=Geovibrio thiophilus TaxID=139438 RepID=A0A3R5XYH7_9BACT|nr:DUF169 domain-containing protein [Geovibrio thiophilus]QAR33859.1 hypothetical protein EP073_10740 [Geovibrio thiophilus]